MVTVLGGAASLAGLMLERIRRRTVDRSDVVVAVPPPGEGKGAPSARYLAAVASLVLGPLLRHVSETTATIWVETDEPCTVEVLGHRTPTFSVCDHHYALVIVEGLAPGLDDPLRGAPRWRAVLAASDMAVPAERDPHARRRARCESCSVRAGRPHRTSRRGRSSSITTRVRAGSTRSTPTDCACSASSRPSGRTSCCSIGDQVYADDSSPQAREKVEQRRGHLVDDDRYPGLDDVADFEEYTWLYHEAWLPEVERWMFSVVPSAMIFDDHDMIDDWNTSQSWLEDIRRKPWWHDRVTGGLMSYWVYQHLGNLSPSQIRAEGMLQRFIELGDATSALTAWAEEADRYMGVPGGYRFSYFRELGPVRLVVIDSRCARVLQPDRRRMVDDEQWAWVVEHADVACEHLLLATSVPVAIPGGLHDIEEWNELVSSEGRWGRPLAPLGEMIRRAVDLEDWASFHDSYRAMMDLLHDVARPGRHPSADPPMTVTILSGDVHFSYRSRAMLAERPGGPPPVSRVHQVVNSPIRNVLTTRERRVIKAVLSPVGELVGRALRRSAGARRDPTPWNVEDGPFFANHMCLIELGRRDARMVLERAEPDAEGRPVLTVAAQSAL